MKKIIARKKRKEKNEYAICTESIGSKEGTTERSEWDEDAKDRYDRCLKHVKPEEHKKKAQSKDGRFSIEEPNSLPDAYMVFDNVIGEYLGGKNNPIIFDSYEDAITEIQGILEEERAEQAASSHESELGLYDDEGDRIWAKEHFSLIKEAKKKKKKKTPAWTRSEGKSRSGGLNQKGRDSYNKETGGNLKAPVTEDKPKGKRKKRQNSYCARSKGQQDMHNINCRKTPDKPLCKARKRWNCSFSLNDFIKSAKK